MKLVNIPVRNLVPTQKYVDLYRMEEVASRFNPNLLEPITVVEDDSHFLIANGHHRASMIYFLKFFGKGDLEVPSLVMEDDRELAYICSNGRSKSSIHSFRLNYSKRNRVARTGLPSNVPDLSLSVYEHLLHFRSLEISDACLYGPIDGKRELLLELPEFEEVRRVVEEYRYLAA